MQAESSICPRCSSKNVVALSEREKAPASQNTDGAPKRTYSAPVLTDTKESWKRFHSSAEPLACVYCGSKEFDMDWRKREKTCRKCGNVAGLKRRTS